MRAVQMKNYVYLRPLAENPQVHIGFFRGFVPLQKEAFSLTTETVSGWRSRRE